MALTRGNNPNPAAVKKAAVDAQAADPAAQADNPSGTGGPGAKDPDHGPGSASAAAADPVAQVESPRYLAAKKRIRDPYQDIMYDRNTPKPAGDTGWCRAQVAAGVLLEVAQKKAD